MKQPISKEEYAAKKAALEQRAKSATKKPLEVTPEQLASDELYETYAPTGTDADAEIIGKPLADKIAKTGNKAVPNAPVWDKVAKVENGKSDDDILEDLGDLT